MRAPLLLATLAALMLTASPALASEAEGITLPAHCALPLTVECIEDWVNGVSDGRWVRTVLCIAGPTHWCHS